MPHIIWYVNQAQQHARLLSSHLHLCVCTARVHRSGKAAIPHMAQQGGGRIVNIGSLTGFIPVPLRGIYSATKGAVLRLTDALRVELKPLGIQVGQALP
jgi:short-subunit dehydrogenase